MSVPDVFAASPPHRRTRAPISAAGMTLVELLVTLAIVAGLMGMSVYSIGVLTNSELRGEAMRLSSAMKYTWTRAAMNNTQYRMVLDLEANTYHTEVADAPVVDETEQKVDSSSSEKYLSEKARRAGRKHRRDQGAESARGGPFAVRSGTSYEQVEQDVVEKRSLPEGIQFERVLSASRDEPIRSGRAAIHFFPNGFQQPTIIVLSNGDGAYYSLRSEALTGRVHVYGRKIERPDEFGNPLESDE
ncbi:MAG: Tfp pilus assembly protein FimT/FimU [Bradymonadaceae bacterium]